ncbi:MAG TPA: TPM domain-containing protein [Burkholderiales bacterium]|nr:TPM domain-containing protein [Burkholderiales bacterium]
MPLRAALAAAALLFAAFAALAQVALPNVTSRVTDTSGTLTAQQRSALEERLRAFEAKKGSQIVVVVVPTTQPEAIEQYAIRLAEQVKPGRKKIDDGVILVVAIKDRTLRIEVGYGLEGVIPDAVAKRVVSDDIVPHFKRGDFYGGIDAGVTRLIALIEGEKLPPARRGEIQGPGDGGGLESFLMVGFVLVFIVGGLLRAMLGRFAGSGVIGGLAGIAGWLMLGSIAIGIVVAIVAMFLSLMGGFAGRHGRGGWYSGGWPGGGIGGGWGGGGGGSWGGGGGGFGGGGASGRW